MGRRTRPRSSLTGSRLLDRILGCSPAQIRSRMRQAEAARSQSKDSTSGTPATARELSDRS